MLLLYNVIMIDRLWVKTSLVKPLW